jgi:hypothetical protein
MKAAEAPDDPPSNALRKATCTTAVTSTAAVGNESPAEEEY